MNQDRSDVLKALKTMYQYNADTDKEGHKARLKRASKEQKALMKHVKKSYCHRQCDFKDDPGFSAAERALKIREAKRCKNKCSSKDIKTKNLLSRSLPIIQGMSLTASEARNLRKYYSGGSRSGGRRRKSRSRSRSRPKSRSRTRSRSRPRSRSRSRSQSRSLASLSRMMMGGRRRSKSRSRSRSRRMRGGTGSGGVISGGRRRRRSMSMRSRSRSRSMGGARSRSRTRSRSRGGRSNNPWLVYVKQVQGRMPGVPYSQVLKVAGREWRSGKKHALPRSAQRPTMQGGRRSRSRSKTRSRSRSRRGAALIDRFGAYNNMQGSALIDRFYGFN